MKALRFLFLDVDGVLNSADWVHRRPSKEAFAAEFGVSPERYDHDHLTWALRSVDPDAVAALNEIVGRAGARVVVSSTWRTMYPLPKLERILRRRGFVHRLLGATPDGETVRERGDRRIERGEEIAAWLEALDAAVDVRDIVIIDDDGDMAHLTQRLFQTDARIGLRADHIDAVVGMFGADR
jgi:hypothetical protein